MIFFRQFVNPGLGLSFNIASALGPIASSLYEGTCLRDVLMGGRLFEKGAYLRGCLLMGEGVYFIMVLNRGRALIRGRTLISGRVFIR